MQRVQNGTQIAALPSAAAGSGTPGYFGATADGAPAPTRIGRDWLNAVQEEMMAVIVAGGLTPAAGTLTQVRDAIANMIAAGAAAAGKLDAFAMTSPPTGWLACDGSAVSRTTYSALFAKIGTTYGAGNGTTTFNIPDFRGQFLRGLDTGGAVDPGRSIGTTQGHAVQSHNHANGAGATTGASRPFTYGDTDAGQPGLAGTTVHTDANTAVRQGYTSTGTVSAGAGNGAPAGTFASETRPTNVAALICIKY